MGIIMTMTIYFVIICVLVLNIILLQTKYVFNFAFFICLAICKSTAEQLLRNPHWSLDNYIGTYIIILVIIVISNHVHRLSVIYNYLCCIVASSPQIYTKTIVVVYILWSFLTIFQNYLGFPNSTQTHHDNDVHTIDSPFGLWSVWTHLARCTLALTDAQYSSRLFTIQMPLYITIIIYSSIIRGEQ